MGLSRRLVCGCLAIILVDAGLLAAQPDDQGVYTIARPERSLDEVNRLYSGMPAVVYAPPSDRWERLPRTRDRLTAGSAPLRVVMLGDSIVNDTSRSGWDRVLEAACPDSRIEKVTVVRGSTGCWWYQESGRIERYVCPHRPDLVIIGGISQRLDIQAIRACIDQIRACASCDILLMSGAFGSVDPLDDAVWEERLAADPPSEAAQLRALAQEKGVDFLDMGGLWGAYVRAAGQPLEHWKRDAVHANPEGEQILGRILAAHLAIEPARTLERQPRAGAASADNP